LKHSVLIVDDSLTVRMDLGEIFELAGFSVVACPSLAAAREALTKRRFSVVILDVLLPDGDGIDLLRELRSTSETAATRIMLLSTEAEVRDRVRGLQTGADDYIGKPYDSTTVLARARQLIGAEESPSPQIASRLLVIDDSATFRNEFKSALESRGYNVVTAATGEEGLRAAISTRPNAVIVDGVLPGPLDGADVIRRLKQDFSFRNIPCLLLTGTETPVSELRVLEAGADAYVRKETDLEVILARIVALLRSSGAPMPMDSLALGLLGPKRILTVDDSATYLHELADQLRREGYDVILASSGNEALELLEVQSADCILLDLIMPGLSGQETCRIIKKRPAWKSIPIVILTAVEESATVIDGFNAGADDYIPKSCDFEVLKARVRAQLRRKQFEDEYRSVQVRLLEHQVELAHAEAAREIAETRAAIQPLLRNETWLNTVAHLAHLGGWDWQVAADTFTWSAEQYRIFGLVPDAVRPTREAFLQAFHPEDRDRVLQALNVTLGREGYFEVESRIVQPQGDTRNVICLGQVVEQADGRPKRMVGSVLDVTDRKRNEAALIATLAAKELLIKEVHHRVKNNLQVISSLLNLQSHGLGERERDLLNESQRRVQCMALIHQQLYGQNDLGELDLGDFIRSLTNELWDLYSVDSNIIRLRLELDRVSLGLDQAVPCGLILNELITNALKHAFPHQRCGELVVSLAIHANSHVQMRVADNGVGLPIGLDWQRTDSLGLRIVRILANQLDGVLEYDSAAGTSFTLSFKKKGA
jgi:PAS domain S-box-containing protein